MRASWLLTCLLLLAPASAQLTVTGEPPQGPIPSDTPTPFSIEVTRNCSNPTQPILLEEALTLQVEVPDGASVTLPSEGTWPALGCAGQSELTQTFEGTVTLQPGLRALELMKIAVIASSSEDRSQFDFIVQPAFEGQLMAKVVRTSSESDGVHAWLDIANTGNGGMVIRVESPEDLSVVGYDDRPFVLETTGFGRDNITVEVILAKAAPVTIRGTYQYDNTKAAEDVVLQIDGQGGKDAAVPVGPLPLLMVGILLLARRRV